MYINKGDSVRAVLVAGETYMRTVAGTVLAVGDRAVPWMIEDGDKEIHCFVQYVEIIKRR